MNFLFPLIFAIFMFAFLVYLIGWFFEPFFLNYRKRLNPLIVPKEGLQEKGVSHLQSFGAATTFAQMDMDFSNPKIQQLIVQLQSEITSAELACLCFDAKGKYQSSKVFRIVGEERVTLKLTKGTYHLIPVVNRRGEVVQEWNVHVLSFANILGYAFSQAVAIWLLIHYLIQIFIFFYRLFPSTCPLCQFQFEGILQVSSWLIAAISFVVIYSFTQQRYNVYLYGGYSHDSHR